MQLCIWIVVASGIDELWELGRVRKGGRAGTGPKWLRKDHPPSRRTDLQAERLAPAFQRDSEWGALRARERPKRASGPPEQRRLREDHKGQQVLGAILHHHIHSTYVSFSTNLLYFLRWTTIYSTVFQRLECGNSEWKS